MIKKFRKADVVVNVTIKLNFLTNHNNTNIRITYLKQYKFYTVMEFPAFELIRISRKRNITAAREQWGLGQLKCSMGRMERYKRDAYHVGKHSRPTPRLAHVIIYLFIYLF